MRQKLLPSAAGAEMYAADRPSGATRMLGSAPPPSSLSGVARGGVIPAACAAGVDAASGTSGAASSAATAVRRTAATRMGAPRVVQERQNGGPRVGNRRPAREPLVDE